jgi:glycosyltransferase involved in cell wall biosynthesis
MNPLLSIIIPTYNRALIISDTINSILSQSYSNWELIIVDDGSTDNTEQIVAMFSEKNPSIHYFKRPDHLLKGPSSCRNYGFSKSKGAIINWFDSDDLYLPNAFQTIVNQFNIEVDAIVVKLEIVDMLTRTIIKENTIQSNQIIEDYLSGKIAFYVCGPFWNRMFLEKQTSLFDEDIKNLDDWDFNLRMLYQNPNILYLYQPLIKYRVHDNSLSHEIGKWNMFEIKSEFRARKKHITILKKNNNPAKLILVKATKIRYKYLFKATIINNQDFKFYFYKKLLIYQILTFDFFGIIKSFMGLMIFKIFNKGYKFLN